MMYVFYYLNFSAMLIAQFHVSYELLKHLVVWLHLIERTLTQTVKFMKYASL